MNKEDIIKKWLNHELSPEEFIEFQKLNEYEDLMKLSENLKSYKAPHFDIDTELQRATDTKERFNAKKSSWLKPLLKIAAILVLFIASLYYVTSLESSTETLLGEKFELTLPDESYVTLNALSTLTYSEKDWKNEREVHLSGEAYFEVEKGSSFKVISDLGSITVLGTKFNVKQRENSLTVTCYEGSVQVSYDQKSNILKSGDRFVLRDGKFIAIEKESSSKPSWLHDVSSFESVPFEEVIAELERQYDVHVTIENYQDKTIFSGNFPHQNLELALKAITKPLGLTYSMKRKEIILSRD